MKTLLFVFAILVVSAQAKEGLDSSLAIVIAATNAAVSPPASRLERAREELSAAMIKLEPMISGSNEASWREKLHLASLSNELKSESPDAASLANIYRQLFFNHPGMESAEVNGFRQAVREMKDAAYFTSLRDLEGNYRRVVGEIASLMPVYEEKQRSEDRISLGAKISWLERSRLAPQLVQMLRTRYSGTNSVAQFHIGLVEKYAVTPVDKTSDGSHVILGTPTNSISRVTGTTYLKFIPSQTHAEVEVGMVGRMVSHSRGVGGERGVTVQVTSQTENSVHVAKRFSIRGFSQAEVTAHPPTATVTPVTSQSQINSTAQPLMPRLPPRLQVLRKVKENIGYSTAQDRLPAGQAEGRRIAAGELEKAANQPVQVPPEVTNVAQQFQAVAKEFFVLSQQREGVYPRRQVLATDSQWLYATHLRHSEEELAALEGPPPYQSNALQFGVRMHESELANLANRQLAAGSLTDASVEGFARSVFNYVPAPLRTGTHTAKWTAKFFEVHPLAIDFENDNRIEFRLRLERLDFSATKEQPARSFTVPFEIRAVYRPLIKNGAPMLERIEEATLAPLTGSNEPLDEELVRSFGAKATAFFSQELHFDGLAPVRGGIFEPLTKVIIKEFRCENNWLLLAADYDGDLLEAIKKAPSGLGGDDKVRSDK